MHTDSHDVVQHYKMLEWQHDEGDLGYSRNTPELQYVLIVSSELRLIALKACVCVCVVMHNASYKGSYVTESTSCSFSQTFKQQEMPSVVLHLLWASYVNTVNCHVVISRVLQNAMLNSDQFGEEHTASSLLCKLHKPS